MEITIKAQTNSSVAKDLPMALDAYTILAGKNNSGKTSIINGIIKGYGNELDPIYIPADRISPDKEIKNSARGDPFYVAISKLLAPIFNTKMMDELKKDFEKEKKDLVKGVNMILSDFGVDDTEFDIGLKEIDEALVVKLAKAFAKDMYHSETDSVELDKIGTGALRMILAALIRYYAETEKPLGKKTLIIFEEPEICLHPKWKRTVRDSLDKLSDQGVKVLITTHDPYFVELGDNKKIYEVRRNQKTGETELEERHEEAYLDYLSEAEISYLIFRIPSETYFLELYEKLLSSFDSTPYKCQHCGKELICGDEECGKKIIAKPVPQSVLDDWVGSQYPKGKAPELSDIRNALGHPKKNNPFAEKDILDGIQALHILISTKTGEKDRLNRTRL